MQLYSFLFPSILFGAFLLAACRPPASAPPESAPTIPQPSEELASYFDPAWAQDKLWDDGLAEVALYDAERIIYGEARPYEYAYLTVKEAMNPAMGTKTMDYDRDNLFDAIKINMFARIPTVNYPYHYLTSVFQMRNDPTQTYKLTQSSQEWCGQTFKEFLHEENGHRFVYHSYWDGQGDGEKRIRGQYLFEDALPVALRALRFATDLTFEYDLIPSQISSKAPIPAPTQARFSVSEADSIAGPEGNLQTAWRVEVQLGDVVSQYFYSREFPHYLLRMEATDGRKMELKSLRRWAYWTW